MNFTNIIKTITPSWFYTWKYYYNTWKIYRTRGACLKYTQLSLRNLSPYKELFNGTENNFAPLIQPFRKEFKWLLGRIHNSEFASIDAEVYYSVIRYFKPEKIIEIGSGHSTWFARDAAVKNGRGQITCIDPQARRNLPPEVNYIRSKVEDVDPIVFNGLKENDILFIDSSHTKEEAEYHINSILPQLTRGVIIHHHDIKYPFNSVYDEESVILDYYQKNCEKYEILFLNSYVTHTNKELVRDLIPSSIWNNDIIGGSLWTKKK